MKKVVSLLLVVVLALGMSTMAFAKITGLGAASQTNANLTRGGGSLTGTNTNLNAMKPGQCLYINFPSVGLWDTTTNGGNVLFLTDGDSNDPTATGGVTKSDLSRGKVTVRTKVAKGSNTIEQVSFDYPSSNTKYARIEIEFVDPFVNNDDDGQDFDFTVFLAVDGDRYEDQGVDLTGTLINDMTTIDSETDYVNLEGGYIVEVDEYNSGLEYYLGNGISIFGKAFKDKYYYGYCDVDTTDAQEILIDKYSFDEVYNIKSIGLQAITSYVVIDDADYDAYVYGADLKYLGQVKDQLAYSSTYYLSSKKLDVDEDDGDDEEGYEPDDEDDVPEAPPVTGGEDDITNSNANPSTGA